MSKKLSLVVWGGGGGGGSQSTPHPLCTDTHLFCFCHTHLQLATSEQMTAIFGVLGQVHISDTAEEDLKAKEDIKVNGILEQGRGLAKLLQLYTYILHELHHVDQVCLIQLPHLI